jgi:lipopolysaccharide/colanic/teichoic acid biosynthesis glycosyltransferase
VLLSAAGPLLSRQALFHLECLADPSGLINVSAADGDRRDFTLQTRVNDRAWGPEGEVSCMQGRNALNVLEAEASTISATSPLSLAFDTISASASVSAWRLHSLHLSSAIQRAFSLRYTIVKRALDIILSSVLIFLFFPLGLAVALAVVLNSPGPVFFRQERLGRFGKTFCIIKFRSMYTRQHRGNVFEIRGSHRHNLAAYPLAKEQPDPRITPVGRIIRKLSIDELPQLLNVFAGEMSLVGPRPIVEAERCLYGKDFAYYDLFCPGITGLWQVNGRSDVDYERRVRYDRAYAIRWSFLLDFKILTRTIPAVLSMRGAY